MDNETVIRIVGFCVAIVPPLVIVGYFVAAARSRVDGELLGSAFGFGAAAAIPAIMFAQLYMHGAGLGEGFYEITAKTAFLVAAVPEEVCKLGALLAVCGRRLKILAPNNLFVLSIAVAGGFACLENIFYVVESETWKSTAILRSISAVPGHAFVGAVMGLCVVRARTSAVWWGGALVLPIALHGAYDFFIMGVANHQELRTIAPEGQMPLFIVAFILIVMLEGLAAHWSLRQILNADDDAVRTGSKSLNDGTCLLGTPFVYTIANTPVVWGGIAILSLLIALSIGLDYPEGLYSDPKLDDADNTALTMGFAAFAVLHGAAFLGLTVVMRRRRAASAQNGVTA